MSTVIKSTPGLYRPYWTVWATRRTETRPPFVVCGSEREVAEGKRLWKASMGHGGKR
jgi:hypothetical protein